MTWRASVDATEVHRSAAWGAPAAATVVVATCDRGPWLPELLASLAAQTIGVEVVLVDDSSTIPVFVTADLPLLVLRTAHRAGPSAARNAGAARAQTDLLLLTDDDCLPAPTWAGALVGALAAAPVVQGKTLPVDADHGPWDRAIEVLGASGLYETCNLGVHAPAFLDAGGFADLHLLDRAGRGFGEDAELGSLLAHGRAAFCPDALVRHRWVPATYRDHLAGRARLAGFPALDVPEVRSRLVAGVGLSRRTLVTDLGLAGVLATAATPLGLVAVAPWARRVWTEAAGRPGRPRGVRAAQLAVADVVGAAALVRGSVRARRLVL